MEWLRNIDIQQWAYVLGGLTLFVIPFAIWLYSGSLIVSYFLAVVISIPLWMAGMLPLQDGRYPPVVTIGIVIIGAVYFGIRIYKQPSISNDETKQ